MKVTTLVVDDEPIARAGLKGMLAAFDWIEVIGEAADGQSAARAMPERPGSSGVRSIYRV